MPEGYHLSGHHSQYPVLLSGGLVIVFSQVAQLPAPSLDGEIVGAGGN